MWEYHLDNSQMREYGALVNNCNTRMSPKNGEKKGNGGSGPIAVRILPPVSEAVKRLADADKRPRQWQVDMLLREGLKAIGKGVD